MPETEQKWQRQRSDNSQSGAIKEVNDKIEHCEGGIGFSEDDELFGERVPPSGGRVDLPATAFNQYNVRCVAAILLFGPTGSSPNPHKELASKMSKELKALERKLLARTDTVAYGNLSHIVLTLADELTKGLKVVKR